MSRPSPTVELVRTSPEDREAVLTVAGVSVTLDEDDLAGLIADAEHVLDLLTCDLRLLIEDDGPRPTPSVRPTTMRSGAPRMSQAERRALWAEGIEERLVYFEPEFIVRDEGVTAETIDSRLRRAGRNDLAALFKPLANAEMAAQKKARARRRRAVTA